jgi:hypothetical protein
MDGSDASAVIGRFQDGLRSIGRLGLLAAIGRSGGGFGQIADLVDSYVDTPQMEESLRRFRALPEGRRMLEERYPPLKPDIPQLAQCPPGSLGRGYARLIESLHYDPEFFRPRELLSDGHWLTQRIATTHDIHHVVSGFGTSPVGENGVLAITATQIGFPAYVMLRTAPPWPGPSLMARASDSAPPASPRSAGRKVGTCRCRNGASASASTSPPTRRTTD